MSRYRKTAATTCEGGEEFDRLGEKVMCPNARRPNNGGGGNGWIAFIILPIIGAGIIFCVLHFRRRGSFGGRIRLPDGTTQIRNNLLSSPILTKIVAAAFVVPVTILGILSHIPIPRSISEVTEILGNIRFPPLFARNSRRNGDYSVLGQDEQADVLLQDYDGSEEHLIDDDELDDADEF